MPDNRPLCELKIKKDGSVDFDSLSNLPADCRLPTKLKHIQIPLEDKRSTSDSSKVSKAPDREILTSMDTQVSEVKMEPKESAPVSSVTAENTVATVGVDQAITQVKSLVPAGSDASPALMIGGAAVLAVVGAAIKFGPSMLKARAEKAEREHEAKMKQLEIEEKKSEKQDDQHQQCNTSRLALEAKVAALSTQVEAVSAKLEKSAGSSFSLGGEDSEDLVEKIEKHDKALKALDKNVKALKKILG